MYVVLLLPLFRNDRKACTFRFCNFRKCHFTFSNCYVVELDNYFFHGYQPSFLFFIFCIKIAPFTDVKDACLRLVCGCCCVVYDAITFFLVSLEARLSEPRLLAFLRLPFHILNLVSIP